MWWFFFSFICHRTGQVTRRAGASERLRFRWPLIRLGNSSISSLFVSFRFVSLVVIIFVVPRTGQFSNRGGDLNLTTSPYLVIRFNIVDQMAASLTTRAPISGRYRVNSLSSGPVFAFYWGLIRFSVDPFAWNSVTRTAVVLEQVLFIIIFLIWGFHGILIGCVALVMKILFWTKKKGKNSTPMLGTAAVRKRLGPLPFPFHGRASQSTARLLVKNSVTTR